MRSIGQLALPRTDSPGVRLLPAALLPPCAECVDNCLVLVRYTGYRLKSTTCDMPTCRDRHTRHSLLVDRFGRTFTPFTYISRSHGSLASQFTVARCQETHARHVNIRKGPTFQFTQRRGRLPCPHRICSVAANLCVPSILAKSTALPGHSLSRSRDVSHSIAPEYNDSCRISQVTM